MSLEEYKKQVDNLLIERHGPKDAARWMKAYKKDFQEFLDGGFSPSTAMVAMYMGY